MFSQINMMVYITMMQRLETHPPFWKNSRHTHATASVPFLCHFYLCLAPIDNLCHRRITRSYHTARSGNHPTLILGITIGTGTQSPDTWLAASSLLALPRKRKGGRETGLALYRTHVVLFGSSNISLMCKNPIWRHKHQLWDSYLTRSRTSQHAPPSTAHPFGPAHARGGTPPVF